MDDLLTPFRQHYEHSRFLNCACQIEECADYVQHPDVLITEFLESYYLVERTLDPELQEQREIKAEAELVLEAFDDSVLLEVTEAAGHVERIECAGGAFDPLPDEEHPALRHRGLDYIGVRSGSSRIVLGVMQGDESETAYLLLLRALNCLAEIAPPFQVDRLRRRVLHDRVGTDPVFDLQLAVSSRPQGRNELALWQLTWDLAEAIKHRILEHPQFVGTLAAIECVDAHYEGGSVTPTMQLAWRV